MVIHSKANFLIVAITTMTPTSALGRKPLLACRPNVRPAGGGRFCAVPSPYRAPGAAATGAADGTYAPQAPRFRSVDSISGAEPPAIRAR